MSDELKDFPQFDKRAAFNTFHDAKSEDIGPGAVFSDCEYLARWQHEQDAKYMASRDKEIADLKQQLASASKTMDRWEARYTEANSKIAEQAQEIERLHEVGKLSEKYWSDKYNAASKDFDEMRNEITRLKSLLDEAKSSVAAYAEYFKAIEEGEYNTNRRPAPLRDFEDVLQLKASAFLSKLEGK